MPFSPLACVVRDPQLWAGKGIPQRVNLEFPLSTTVLAKVQKTIRNQRFFVAYEHYFEDLIAFGS